MSFSQELWDNNQDIISKIQHMDFIQEMLTAELSDEQFFYYIEQDIHYLHDYIRASSYMTARSENYLQLDFFHQLASNAFLEIESIHKKYTSQSTYSKKNTFTAAYKNYSNFILAYAATKPIPVALAALLACPWLYYHVGESYKNYSFENDKYQFWFQANSAPEAQSFLNNAKTLVDSIYNQMPQYREQMKSAFREAMFLEYHFWQDAYELKKDFE